MARNQKGRPTKYTKALAERICEEISSGLSLREICRQDDIPDKSTVLLWVATNRSEFSDQYDKACRARAYHWAEELLDIADDGTNDWMERNGEGNSGYAANGEALQRSRLRIDTRKWLLSKMLPKFSDQPLSKQPGEEEPPPTSVHFTVSPPTGPVKVTIGKAK